MTTVTQECCSKQGELTIQRWLGDAKRTGRKDVCSAKRIHARYAWKTAVLITRETDGHAGCPLHATTCDLSVSGLSLQCKRSLAENTIVLIKTPAWGGAVLGIVRFCTPVMGMFRIGVEFLPDPAAASNHSEAA